MAEKCKKYSFAVSMFCLVQFAGAAYAFIYALLAASKKQKQSIGSVFLDLFDKEVRLETIAALGLIVTIFFLFLAFLLQNRGLFFLACLLNLGIFGLNTYLWIKEAADSDWTWGKTEVAALLFGSVLTGLVILSLFLMSIFLVSASTGVNVFSILARVFAGLGLVIVITTNMLAIYAEDFKLYDWYTAVSQFRFDGYSISIYIFMFLMVLLIGAWADNRKAELEGAEAPAQQAPQAPMQPVYQVPVQPAAPVAAVVPPVAPVAPVQPVAPAQPAAPAQPVAPAQSAAPAAPVAPAASVAPVIAEPVKEAAENFEKTVTYTAESVTEEAAQVVENTAAEAAEAVADEVTEITDEAVKASEENVAALIEESKNSVADILSKYDDAAPAGDDKQL
ncbi:MAG: hypothetical protein J5795_03595 [Lachnospiraceae bacterium]|nr:hypothetical protein [Lachnospiraceae bacterium]